MFSVPVRKRPAVSTVTTVPAPVGGWNARDSLASMKPDDAVYMKNWFPRTTDVIVRRGQLTWATGMTGTIESLMSYNNPTASKLFAAVGTSIYNVSAQGAVGAAETATLTNARFQYINISTAGGAFLYAVNGVDSPLLYNGTTWTSITGVSVPAITGVTTTSLVNIWLFKNRVWFVEKNSLKAWYLPVDSVGGAAASFDLSSVCRRGGYLVAGGGWSIDAGEGLDDYQAFVTSEGEVLIYRGTDPSSAADWALVGRWEVGEPLGRRCLCKFAGDLLLICRDGVLPLSRALQSSRVNPRVALTQKIQYAMSEAASLYGTNFGWQLLLYPEQNMLILNVPTSTTTSDQYVMNTISTNWCQFTGWPAACWEMHNFEIYYGSGGTVYKAWQGNSDSDLNITADCKTAFNYFTHRGNKHFKLVRPIITSQGTPPLSLGLNFDFKNTDPSAVISGAGTTGMLWGTGVWDVDVWGGEGETQAVWQGATGVGYCAATRLKYEGRNYDVSWAATDYVWEKGGAL